MSDNLRLRHPSGQHNGRWTIDTVRKEYGLDHRQARRLRRKWARGWRGPVGGTKQVRARRRKA